MIKSASLDRLGIKQPVWIDGNAAIHPLRQIGGRQPRELRPRRHHAHGIRAFASVDGCRALGEARMPCRIGRHHGIVGAQAKRRKTADECDSGGVLRRRCILFVREAENGDLRILNPRQNPGMQRT